MVNIEPNVTMRDESLFFLFSPITRIKGLGTATSQALQRLLPSITNISGHSTPLVRDLLFHLPVNLLDRRFTCPLNQAPAGVIATFVVKVDAHYPPPSRFRNAKTPYKVVCSNATGTITLIFFHASMDYIKQSLPIGAERVISGRTEQFDRHLQMTHPDIIATVDKLADVQKPEAVYPLTIGLTSKRITKYVESALEQLPVLPEWIDSSPLSPKGGGLGRGPVTSGIPPEEAPLPGPPPQAREGEGSFPTFKNALQQVHHPLFPEDLLPISAARKRLAYDEMLANQLHLAMLRRNMQQQAGTIIKGTDLLTKKLLASLPFKLTIGQLTVLQEIYADMVSSKRMGRLLQGDVGSGKTIVALLAMLRVAEHSGQSALMVPTEIIAQQHYETLSKLTAELGIKIGLLTGSVQGKARQAVLEGIHDGSIAIVVGTHALFQEHVVFRNLALVVIDEQHRFGVGQRMALMAKGNAPHLLHMTATPIPRSLTMTLYGDMDCSLLMEKPAERLPITTRVIPLSRYDEIMERMKDVLAKGEKIYWICPLIEDDGLQVADEEGDVAAAETRFTEFKARFGGIVGMVHGRMKNDQRDAEMKRFASGDTQLLVATTVVEVGVDVRDATIIVIEKAERFGLSQIHQLRGRVGRGNKPSFCVLLCSDRVSDISRNRLLTLRETEDGFKIAEADLQIRGGGDLLGARQSGLPRFIFTDLLEHLQLLEHARNDASDFLKSDPEFKTPRGKALQVLLQLFGG